VSMVSIARISCTVSAVRPADLDVEDLVSQTGADAVWFVDGLSAYAARSRAAQHPLLDTIAAGQFSDLQHALRRLFTEYYAYSRRFTKFLAATMASLDEPRHRAALIPNTAEEAGQLDDDHRAELRIAGLDPDDVAVAHPELFRRFLSAIGIADATSAPPHVATVAWIEAFEAVCRSGECQSVGALGIATEGIVRTMYVRLLAGIRRAWPELSGRDRAFFELHALVDDEHAETLRTIAIDLANTPARRRELAVGVLGALGARATFYDHMYALLVREGQRGQS
jgi:pyrroloquinoline quinone (PQQ) biosynthesis protein C